jgi:hypothetical protein
VTFIERPVEGRTAMAGGPEAHRWAGTEASGASA